MRGAELLSKRVVMRGIQLGRVVDVILEESADRPIGLDVLCGDGQHRFLPMATVQIEDGQVEVESPLMLLEREQLDFYRARGRALRSVG
jgi:hypothetical protein